MKTFFNLVIAVVFVQVSIAQEHRIFITTGKTSSLIFPYAIRHVDRGSKEVLVEAVPGADHILLVKAATKDFTVTNLSIVTGEGSVYSIGVAYGEDSTWVYRFPPIATTPVSTYANSLLNNPATVKGIRDVSWGMSARIIGIYVKGDVLYYQLELANESPIDYDISFLRLYLRDRRKAKRTADQEIELKPLYTAGDTSRVLANTTCNLVVALQKFTLSGAKYLAIEIREINGGRNLLLKAGNKKIMHATSLTDKE